MFQRGRYFVAMKRFAAAALIVLIGCTDISEDSQPSQNDSLAIVPVGPGTDPSAITPPDTPGSQPDTAKPDSARR